MHLSYPDFAPNSTTSKCQVDGMEIMKRRWGYYVEMSGV